MLITGIGLYASDVPRVSEGPIRRSRSFGEPLASDPVEGFSGGLAKHVPGEV